jgi:hypothetical protein
MQNGYPRFCPVEKIKAVPGEAAGLPPHAEGRYPEHESSTKKAIDKELETAACRQRSTEFKSTNPV